MHCRALSFEGLFPLAFAQNEVTLLLVFSFVALSQLYFTLPQTSDHSNYLASLDIMRQQGFKM